MTATETAARPVRRLKWQLAQVREIVVETYRVKSLLLHVANWRGHLSGQHVDIRLTAEDGYQAQRVSVLGSGISGTISDPVTSHIRLLVPVDAIIGLTFTPWGVSVYGFGGVAIGDVKVTVPPFSATQSMAGWSVGVGVDVQLTPVLSAGVKYRHFDLARQDFSIFADEAPTRQRARRHRYGYPELAHYDAPLNHHLWLRRHFDVSAPRPPELSRVPAKTPRPRTALHSRSRHQDTYPPHSLPLLSACGKRATRPPRGRTP